MSEFFQPGPNVWASGLPGEGGAAFHDIDENLYPFVMCALDDDTLQEMWRVLVEGPGAVDVPSLRHTGRPVRARVYFANGMVTEHRPNGEYAIYDLSNELDEINRMIEESRGH